MAPPVRYPNGVTTVSKIDPLNQFPLPHPGEAVVFWDDFLKYNADDWTVTATGTSPVALADSHGGVLTITTGSTENNGDFLEAEGEAFLMTGKKTWMEIRFKINDVTQSDFIFGLHSTDTTPQDATYRAFFESVDGSAAIYFNVDDDTTDTDSSTVATLVDDTWIKLAAYFDGGSTIKLYADGVHVTTMEDVTVPASEMAVGFGCLTGEAAAQTCSIDYILVASER